MTLPISFEFFPPNTPVGDEKLEGVVRQLSALPSQVFPANGTTAPSSSTVLASSTSGSVRTRRPS